MQASETDQFEDFVKRYQAPFFRLALRIVRDPGDAEDVLQEAFFRIYRYRGKFRKVDGGSFNSWAYRIVKNTAITHYYRWKKRQRCQGLEESVTQLALVSHETWREFVERRDVKTAIPGILAELSKSCREIFRLFYMEQLSYLEIQELTGLSMPTIKLRLYRARAVLKGKFSF
ncbi:MAG: RNA polymerase sigma factor [Candidatus Sungbacteria bacterium]|nr:RNA polymerase sigma factor [Candidatus Sungbacteria bacterium]